MKRSRAHAVAILLAACLATGVWPGYTRGIVRLHHAEYLASRWLQREIEEMDVKDLRPKHRRGGRPKGSKNLTKTQRVRDMVAKQREIDAKRNIIPERSDEPAKEV